MSRTADLAGRRPTRDRALFAVVTEDEFRDATLAIMQSGTPSAGDNLLGMEMDFYVRLGELDEVDEYSVVVQRTEHAERMIRASCTPTMDVPPSDAVEVIRREWLADLRYAYMEAHCVSASERGMTLDFVTQIAPGGLYVTGRVEVCVRG